MYLKIITLMNENVYIKFSAHNAFQVRSKSKDWNSKIQLMSPMFEG